MPVAFVEVEGPEEGDGEDLVLAEARRGPAEDVVWILALAAWNRFAKEHNSTYHDNALRLLRLP